SAHIKSHVHIVKYDIYKNIVSHHSMKISVALLLVTLFLSSCLKDSDREYSDSTIVSALTVVNASPGTPPLDFVLDNQRVQKFSYQNDKINYFAAFSGKRFARIFESGQSNQSLFEFEIRLLQGKYYSLFINGIKDDMGSLLIEDDL